MVEERQRQRTDFGRFSPKKGPYRHSETPINPNDFIDREPYRPDFDRKITPPFAEPYRPDFDRKPPNYFPMSSNFNQFDNSGIMLALNDTSALDKLRNIYDQASPYIPDINLNDQTLGYNFNQPFMGGDLSFGYGFDVDDQQSGGYLNWGTDW